MTYQPIAPFMRAVDAKLLRHHAATDVAPPTETGIDKWDVLRALTTARAVFGLSNRELTVLQALLGFHPDRTLHRDGRPLVVYPSNATLAARLHGMAGSTLRRHLAGLVASGLVLRRDSPNGKRYVRRLDGETQAFGFDLAPLVARFPEIAAAAASVTAETERLERLRRDVSLMRRDLAALIDYGTEARPDLELWTGLASLAAEASRTLRRKPEPAALEALEAVLLDALDTARAAVETEEMSTSSAHIEHLIPSSEKRNTELEDGQERVGDPEPDAPLPKIPLSMVLGSCSEFRSYVPEPVRHWHQLVRAAETLRPMMGISASAWSEAVETMGCAEAAVVVVAMLERFGEIRSPGAYLRHLARRKADGAFSCGPMLMALKRQRDGSSQL